MLSVRQPVKAFASSVKKEKCKINVRVAKWKRKHFLFPYCIFSVYIFKFVSAPPSGGKGGGDATPEEESAPTPDTPAPLGDAPVHRPTDP